MDLLAAVDEPDAPSFFDELDELSFLGELFDPSDDDPSDAAPSEEAPSEEAPSEEEALAEAVSLDLRA